MEKNALLREIDIEGVNYTIADINRLADEGIEGIEKLPFSIKIIVENLLRKLDGRVVTQEHLRAVAGWQKRYDTPVEIPYHPARVLMQDFTGVPAVVDLAVMRDAVSELGGDPSAINPLVPVELVVDHSVQLDYYGTENALSKNVAKEYERNVERYELLKWAQKSFDNFQVVPPNSGICHQVNLEHLGRVVIADKEDGRNILYPDTLLGTDSHTPMINGIGVMGWGVGGIEAEAVMLGQPYYMTIPEVIGVRMTGTLAAGVTATDLVLTITELLRKRGVVEKFVEYFGPGMKALSVTDRATIANMTPENGATLGLFPVDEKTLEYLKLTGRGAAATVTEHYAKAMGLFYTGENDPEYTEVIEFDLSCVEPSVAGPARPQDRIAVKDLKARYAEILGCKHDRDAPVKNISDFHDESGTVNSRESECIPCQKRKFFIRINGKGMTLGEGSIVIAAITSCTNTSNPYVMIGAGLLARNAVKRGLSVPPYVKTSLAPGSKVVTDYLEASGTVPYLEALGFHTAGFGCTTCIGNGGPLHPEIEKVIEENNLNVASVLSGNRNFEARIHQKVRGNFLASPILVVAYAIAGAIDVDLETEPVGMDPNGEPVFLSEIWPEASEIEALVSKCVGSELFEKEYATIFDGDRFWQELPIKESVTFNWDPSSTYIKKPPYFDGVSAELTPPSDLKGARALLVLGDSVTTDHISPAGAIPSDYPAGEYLVASGVPPEQFNSYGSRRGNHEVMMRGTFGNVRIKNRLVEGKEGSFTVKFPENETRYIYDAAMAYKAEKTPLVVLGGKEYGTGSSRDWAAKGSNLLGVSAVIAESYERIHRSNLVGMGVLPLVFAEGEGAAALGLDGTEIYAISGIEKMTPRKRVTVTATRQDGTTVTFTAVSRLDTVVDVDYFENGGILPCVLRKIMASAH